MPNHVTHPPFADAVSIKPSSHREENALSRSLIFVAILVAGCGGKTSSNSDPVSETPPVEVASSVEIAPTGLTIVVCDASNRVLDAVVIADDQQSRTVRFSVPEELGEIGVFVVGDRVNDFLADLLPEEILIGRGTDQGGSGFIDALIENGVLVGLERNSGIRVLELDETLKKEIREDIAKGERSPFVTVTVTGEQSDADYPGND